MMQIQSLQVEPIAEIKYLTVSQSRSVEIAQLPVIVVQVDALPRGIDALIATSDLQGIEAKKSGAQPRLLGEVVVEQLRQLSDQGVIPAAGRTAVILGGDFFSRPQLDRRGGTGDTSSVWRAFADNFKWVTGVAGNHDLFSDQPSLPAFERFRKNEGKMFLDGNYIDIDGLRIGGISGVIGNPRRPFRKTAVQVVETVRNLLDQNVSILVMHQGPDHPNEGLQENAEVRGLLEKHSQSLIVIRGHKHWERPLVSLNSNVQVLNVDSRVAVLTAGN